MGQKVLLIGLDGATFDIIDPLSAEKKLPNISRLIAEGVRGELKSTIHPITPAAWASCVTGLNPGKHGVYDFRRRRPFSYETELVNARLRHGLPLWTLLSQQGKKVGVFNVPLTYPPDEVNGFMISGFDTPSQESQFVYPQELFEELKALVSEYIFEPERKSYSSEEEYASQINQMLDQRIEILHFLLDKYADFDFFMTVFIATDRHQHAFWKYFDPTMPDYLSPKAPYFRAAFEECYTKIDDVIGELLERFGEETTIIIMSDHGFGPLYKDVYLNKWLADLGLLRFHHEYYEPGTIISLRNVDWRHTKAYSFGFFGNININMQGREPLGTVERGREAEELAGFITAKLYRLLEPDTGELLVDRVYRREELYHGPHVEQAPDLLITMRNYAYMIRGSYEFAHDELVAAPMKYHPTGAIRHSGNHRLNGILIMGGTGMREGTRVQNAEILDITPTVLYIMGLPIPLGMDGKVLEEAFDPTYRRTKQVKAMMVAKAPYISPAGEENADAYIQSLQEELRQRDENITKLHEEFQNRLNYLNNLVEHLAARVASLEHYYSKVESFPLVGLYRLLQRAMMAAKNFFCKA